MKKLKMMTYVFLISFLFIPAVHAIEATKTSYVACGDATGIPAPVPQLTSIAYTLLITATPVLLIVFSIVTLLKAITAGSQDDIMKAKGKLIKKFIIAGAIFFIAVIVRFVVTKAADATEKDSISNCLNCFLYHRDCRESVGPYEAGGLISSSNTSSGSNANGSSPKTSSTSITTEYPTNYLACRYRNSSGDEYQLEYPNFLVVRHKEGSGYARVESDSFKREGNSGSCPEKLKFTVSNGFLTISDATGSGTNIYTKYSTNSSNSNSNGSVNGSAQGAIQNINSNSNSNSNGSAQATTQASKTWCEYLAERKDESEFGMKIYNDNNCGSNNGNTVSIPISAFVSEDLHRIHYEKCEEYYNKGDDTSYLFQCQSSNNNTNQANFGSTLNSPIVQNAYKGQNFNLGNKN